jgi:hypothetical protein
MKALDARLAAVEQHTKDSGEIPALVERTIEGVSREADGRKRKAFAALLANAIAEGPKPAYDQKLTLLDTLDSLTEQDVVLLSPFNAGQPVRVDSFVSTSGMQRASSPMSVIPSQSGSTTALPPSSPPPSHPTMSIANTNDPATDIIVFIRCPLCKPDHLAFTPPPRSDGVRSKLLQFRESAL